MPSSRATAQPDAASFRDPSGTVVWYRNQPYRLVHQRYAPTFQSATEAGLFSSLIEAELLVGHQQVDPPFAVSQEIELVIQPELVPMISYPFEWSFSQLKDAALLTLDIQERAMQLGYSLKDASSYNIQFIGSQPKFIDTLSFEPFEPKPWIAYRQFCQHFLAPLSLLAYADVRLARLQRAYVDGLHLDLTATLLPWRARFSASLFIHIFMHARSQHQHAGDGVKLTSARPSQPMPLAAVQGLVQSLRAAIDSLHWQGSPTEWADYYERNNNYTSQSIQYKEQLVSQYLADFGPKTVWDLGGNTGRFSRLATSLGASTVCWDIDPMAIESLYRQLRQEKDPLLLPLFQDFGNPTPDLGWDWSERQSVVSRGPADVVMALALVHHLAIGNNVPLPRIASWLASLCRQGAIIEFVPKEDSQVQKLLATREDIFPTYTVEDFERCLAKHFTVHQKEQVAGSQRWLYCLHRKG